MPRILAEYRRPPEYKRGGGGPRYRAPSTSPLTAPSPHPHGRVKWEVFREELEQVIGREVARRAAATGGMDSSAVAGGNGTGRNNRQQVRPDHVEEW
jgi:hypothetical protein